MTNVCADIIIWLLLSYACSVLTSTILVHMCQPHKNISMYMYPCEADTLGSKAILNSCLTIAKYDADSCRSGGLPEEENHTKQHNILISTLPRYVVNKL